jgi:hypothetical protein
LAGCWHFASVLAFAPFIPLGWIIDEGAQMLETLLKFFGDVPPLHALKLHVHLQ